MGADRDLHWLLWGGRNPKSGRLKVWRAKGIPDCQSTGRPWCVRALTGKGPLKVLYDDGTGRKRLEFDEVSKRRCNRSATWACVLQNFSGGQTPALE